jgi:hypothetical protein
MENSNIYQYGGFKSKIDRNKIKGKIFDSADVAEKKDTISVAENPE